MNTTDLPAKPDWLTPGAKVIVHRTSTGTSRIKVTTIAKIATKSFTVADSPARYRLSTLDRHETGTWGAWERIIPLDSDEGRELLDRERRRRLVVQARNACDRWMVARAKGSNRELRLAAIAALQAVEDEEPL